MQSHREVICPLQRHLKDTHSKCFTCPLCQKFSATSRTMYRMRRHLEKVHHVDPNVYFSFKGHAHNNRTASWSCPIPSLLSLNVRLPPQPYAPTATISTAPKDVNKNEPLKTVTESGEASKQMTNQLKNLPLMTLTVKIPTQMTTL